jgi:hypothetical protein
MLLISFTLSRPGLLSVLLAGILPRGKDTSDSNDAPISAGGQRFYDIEHVSLLPRHCATRGYHPPSKTTSSSGVPERTPEPLRAGRSLGAQPSVAGGLDSAFIAAVPAPDEAVPLSR